MAVRYSIATGNASAAGTWGLVDSTSYLNAENATESLLTTAYSGTRSAAFTPGAITISHIGVKLCERIGTTGTMSVCLELDSGDTLVTGTEVTINTADLPSCLETDANGGWIFFKLSSPVLLLAATAYQVAAKTSSATMVDLWCDGTVDNLSRCLVTTTTGAPAAGDDMIVAREFTGAGTSNTFTVTWDITAATDYGSGSTSLVTPALAICTGGTVTFGTTAATNYVMRLSGNAIVYSGGTFNRGTTGTPMPRDSTGWLEFDCSADGDFGLTARNLATDIMQGLSRTSGKNFDRCFLNTDEAANSTSLGVDTDTGWLDNDVIAVATTTRTATQSEKGTLNGAAGASTMTVDGFAGAGGGLAFAHSGTSPTQAEVILLTRNVGIRSVSSTAMAYVNVKATATVDWDWAELYYLGENTVGKRGVEVETTTGSFAMSYCCVRDTEDYGIYVTGAACNNFTVQHCVLWNTNNAAVAGNTGGIHLASSTTGTNWLLDNIIVMNLNGVGNYGIYTNDVGGTITNNTIVGIGMYLVEANVFGTISGNTVHSGVANGLVVTNTSIAGDTGGTISNTTIWRVNTAVGMQLVNCANITFDGLVMFGNTTCHLQPNTCRGIHFKNGVFNGDTTFSTTHGIVPSGIGAFDITFTDCTFGVVTGIKTAHTQDVQCSSMGFSQLVFRNCLFASATEVASQTIMVDGSFIASDRHDQTSGLFKAWKKYGTLTIDTTIFGTASPSLRLTPNNATYKLTSETRCNLKCAVATGTSVTASIKVRESIAGDGTDYNGSRPRLIVRGNAAMGISADTVLDTATAAAEGAFETLSGTTPTVTEDGILEFYVDCDGTTGWVNVDDFEITAGNASSAGMKYWKDGTPQVFDEPGGGGGIAKLVGFGGGLVA